MLRGAWIPVFAIVIISFNLPVTYLVLQLHLQQYLTLIVDENVISREILIMTTCRNVKSKKCFLYFDRLHSDQNKRCTSKRGAY